MHDSLAPWLLLPVKSIHQGKQRLKSALSDRERVQLNEFFLVRMLAVANCYPGLDRTAVVSDAEDTSAIASSYGARTIRSDGPGLNRALTDGHRILTGEHDASLMVLPIDLPFVEPDDIRQLSLLGRKSPIIVCPDRHWSGTNAIFLAKGVTIPFYFGERSLQKHIAEADRYCGEAPYIHFSARLSLDIDTPADLALLRGGPAQTIFQRHSLG
jgi:2-phospho-L-lactate guanylyltransferase